MILQPFDVTKYRSTHCFNANGHCNGTQVYKKIFFNLGKNNKSIYIKTQYNQGAHLKKKKKHE